MYNYIIYNRAVYPKTRFQPRVAADISREPIITGNTRLFFAREKGHATELRHTDAQYKVTGTGE